VDITLTARDRLEPPPPPDVELAIGARVGRYVVEDRLGAGGMGVVYAAWDTALARSVALKIVRPRAAVDATQARLRREAKAMARLSHRNVVPVFDIATHDGRLFIAMELVEGETLRSWVSWPRPWRDVVQLFVKAGRGLEAAHAAGIAHRDFKPDNVMVGEGDEPRITDFGLARELDGGDISPSAMTGDPTCELLQVTATGSLAGTPAYMAPEQLLDKQSGPAADQFSFCVSLFEVLYGVRPFWTEVRGREARPESLIDEIRAGRIVKPEETRGVPRWLHAVIVRGLAHAPEDRWPSMRELVAALGRSRRRRWLSVTGVAAAVAVVSLGLIAGDRDAPPSCAEATTKGIDAVTIVVCKDEYTRTNDPHAGALLAGALRRTRNVTEAAAVANELLATSARADALYNLGKIATDDNRREDAERSLRLAGELHRRDQQWGEAAADLLALAKASNDVVDQLVSLDQAASDAHRGGRRSTEAASHLAAAGILSTIGARTAAFDELERATPMLTAPSDRVQLDLERGNVYQNLEDHAAAIAAFKRAQDLAAPSTRLALSVRLNLAYSLAAAGQVADAAIQAAEASTLDPGDRRIADRLAIDAWIAAHAGEPARAAVLVERALAATSADASGDLIEREVQRAEIALQQGDFSIAEEWARRAIARIETLRSTHPPVELRSWLITDRRIPYEILFASLARRGDAAGALAVFDRYRGLSVLAGLIRGDGHASLPGIAFPIAEVARLLPPLEATAFAQPGPERQMLDALRAASLLVLVVAHDELWRITADHGRLDVALVGSFPAVRPQLDRFRANPGDLATSLVLGQLLVPVEIARPSDQVLHVILDERLAAFPVAALRTRDHRLIAARPIVHATRPSEVGCATRPAGPHREIAIDATGELAVRLSIPSASATRTSLFDVARADLVYLAVSAEPSPLGDVLALGDGRVSALEIAGRGGAAAQMVLAGRDASPEGSSSLAMGFLAAGAEQVIATIRPVAAASAARLADRLHRSDTSDLVRALARLQANDFDDSFGFAAFGRTTCNL
jgi:tetratricopeptide (TPR) repeat protein/predicted Ser/Thr protein kinase